MIFSTGIDIVYIARLVKFVNDNAFLDRILTDKEREYIFTKRDPYRHLAGRLGQAAAKARKKQAYVAAACIFVRAIARRRQIL